MAVSGHVPVQAARRTNVGSNKTAARGHGRRAVRLTRTLPLTDADKKEVDSRHRSRFESDRWKSSSAELTLVNSNFCNSSWGIFLQY